MESCHFHSPRSYIYKMYTIYTECAKYYNVHDGETQENGDKDYYHLYSFHCFSWRIIISCPKLWSYAWNRRRVLTHADQGISEPSKRARSCGENIWFDCYRELKFSQICRQTVDARWAYIRLVHTLRKTNKRYNFSTCTRADGCYPISVYSRIYTSLSP